MNEGRGIIIKGIARRVLPITAVILITVFSLSVHAGLNTAQNILSVL
jgi:hypothetical protein